MALDDGPSTRPTPPGGGTQRSRPSFGAALVLLALAYLVVQLIASPPVTRLTYSGFLAQLDSGHVTRVTVGENRVRGALKPAPGRRDTLFVANRVADPALADTLRRRGVAFDGETRGGVLASVLTWVLPLVLMVWLWSGIARRAAGEATSVLGLGRSRARVYAEKDTRVTFADVAGVDEAKAELQEIVAFLRDPARFGRLGARMPRGVLLVGPPGTGKTLLARAVAGEAGVPFLSINGSEFVEMFVGLGAARVRSLFEQARQDAPCIIFIDEIDALGRARGSGGVSGANDEKEQTLNQLLADLDGFSPERGVVLLAATNRPETLDPALLRAGRFDRQIVVDRPDRAGRVQILRVHAGSVRMEPGLDLDAVAALTPGFTGADLANLVNEAALGATRRGAQGVTLDDFGVAVERIVAGAARKTRVLSPREREITAVHETGHALVALATPGADPVQKVSIIPRSIGALGYTLQRPVEDRYIATRAELRARLSVLLGGRAAELVAFQELSTGAADDLARATELAREMVMRYGMDDTVGNAVYAGQGGELAGAHPLMIPEPRVYSQQTAREIDTAVGTLLREALDGAVAQLEHGREALERCARLLIERETLTREELEAAAAGRGDVTPPRVVVAPAAARRVSRGELVP
ncbi:MAG TPA: ATP-dependent zinc metalloprotease FtsH [Longimicrobium sp.]|nr:ATP-dependent zinc metalloprotease FtsH [Longimicrobium sp.]